MKKLTYKLFFENLCLYSALLLFPGFFFYHTAVAVDLMPPVIGGFFTPIAILILIIYLPLYFIFNCKLSKVFLLYFSFFIFWGFYVFIEYVIKYRLNNLGLLSWGLVAVITNVTSYITMLHFNLNDKKTVKYFFISFIIMCLIVLFYSNNGRFYLKAETDIDGVASYQGFARSLLFVFYVCYVAYNNQRNKAIVMIISTIILFMNSARSELIFFIVSIFIFNFINLRKDKFTVILNLFLITLVSINFDYILAKFSSNRLFELMHISKSTSFEGREEFAKKAWQVIQDHPLLGDYGYYIDIYGIGSYSHNILSAWADFGILGFIFFLGISLYLLIFFINKIIFKASSDKSIQLLFLFSSTLLLGYLTAKDYSFMFFGLSLGLYVNYLQSTKYKEKK